MELASSKDPILNATSSPDISFLEQSLLTDQISLLSREWRWILFHVFSKYTIFILYFSILKSTWFSCICSYAGQLVLYMKAEDFLSSALHTAKVNIKQGQLLPSTTVKQGNDDNASSIMLQKFFWWMIVCCYICVSSSNPKVKWHVQELCVLLSLPQWSIAKLPSWQAEAHRPLQWTNCRETHLQSHCAHGELMP